jgi:plastocyanin
MIFRLVTLSVVLASASLMSCGSEEAGTTPADHTITVSNNKFTPAALTVKAGQTVEWVFQEGIHDVTSGTTNPGDATTPPSCKADGKFTSGDPQSSGTFRYKFTTAGVYPYFCTPHCNPQKQFGSVTVTP